MISTLDLDEARDEEVATRTERNFNAMLAGVRAGDKKIVASVDDDLSHLFSDREVMGRLIVLAVTDEAAAGVELQKLIHSVVRLEAENEALKEVEQIEAERAADFDEFDAQMVVPANGPWRHLARA